MITKPLHVATVGKKQLRFFRTPNDDGRPDFAWHAVDDLQQCLGLDGRASEPLRKAYWESAEFRTAYRTIAIERQLISVAPHHVAQGLIDAMIQLGLAPSTARTEYENAGVAALAKLTLHLPFQSEAFFAWMKAAIERHENAEDIAHNRAALASGAMLAKKQRHT
jgi:hypothetical protein